eukprot:1892976-Rhodomonas_salina.5
MTHSEEAHGTEERRGVPEALGLDPHPHALDQLPNHRDLPALCRVVEHSVAGPRRHVQLRAQRQQRLQHRFVPLHRSVVHPVQFRRVPVVHVGVGTLRGARAAVRDLARSSPRYQHSTVPRAPVSEIHT